MVVRQAETANDIEKYYYIYQQTVKRWGADVADAYPQRLFANIYMQKDPNASFWLAQAEGKTVAGIIMLSWNKNLMYWHGCALKEYFKFYPNNLLHAAVMQWGCENGFQYYDMGASMGIEGVVRFKESFGAKPHKFKSFRW